MNRKTLSHLPWSTLALAAFVLTTPSEVRAHCDTLDGPVITEARAALASGDVTPVLKWVRPTDEGEIREAFKKAMAVRSLGAAARELADRFFFETLVRVHRAGEGAPYTGLKPAGSADSAVKLADEALKTGSPEKLVKVLTEAVENGLRRRYAHAVEKEKRSADSIEAGREFVEAYVEYVHFVEGLHRQLKATTHHQEAGAGPDGKEH